MALIDHFEWDPVKARSNAAKHRVTFRLATTVFRDQLALTIFDDEHSENEERWVTLGRAESGQHLVVVHTVLHTGTAEVLIRIISARAADKQEIRDYQETPR